MLVLILDICLLLLVLLLLELLLLELLLLVLLLLELLLLELLLLELLLLNCLQHVPILLWHRKIVRIGSWNNSLLRRNGCLGLLSGNGRLDLLSGNGRLGLLLARSDPKRCRDLDLRLGSVLLLSFLDGEFVSDGLLRSVGH